MKQIPIKAEIILEIKKHNTTYKRMLCYLGYKKDIKKYIKKEIKKNIKENIITKCLINLEIHF